MDDAIATLAMTGSTTIVAAMATAAWQRTCEATTRLFRRMGTAQQEAIEGQLIANAARVAQAGDTAAHVRECLLPLWQLELTELVQQHPDAASELQALISQVQDELPQAQYRYAQKIIARDQSSAYGVQNGYLIVHSAPAGRATQETSPAADNDSDSGDVGQ